MFELNRTNHIMKYVASQDKPVAFSAICKTTAVRVIILVHPADAQKYIDFIESATDIYSSKFKQQSYSNITPSELSKMSYPGEVLPIQEVKFNIPCRVLNNGILSVATINPNTFKVPLISPNPFKVSLSDGNDDTIISFFGDNFHSLNRKYGLDGLYTNNVFLVEKRVYRCLNTSRYFKPKDEVVVVSIDYGSNKATLQNIKTQECFKIQTSEIEYFFERIG